MLKHRTPEDQLVVVFNMKDDNIGAVVPFAYNLSVDNTYQYIAIPFTKFKLGDWWKAPSPSSSPKLDLSHLVSITFLKTGNISQEGTFWIDELAFYSGIPAGKIAGSNKQISGLGQPLNNGNAGSAFAVDYDIYNFNMQVDTFIYKPQEADTPYRIEVLICRKVKI